MKENKPLRILLADDVEIWLILYQEWLKVKYHDVKFTLCRRADETLQAIAENPELFDVMILNFCFPGGTGIDVVREAVSIDKKPRLTVMITAHLDVGYLANDAGVDVFMTKPIHAKTFFEIFKNANIET